MGPRHRLSATECNLHCAGGGSTIRDCPLQGSILLSLGQRQLAECLLLMHTICLHNLKLESRQVKGNIDCTAEAD